MFAATGCADAAGVNRSIAITNAVINVVLSLSKTNSSFPWEHGWIFGWTRKNSSLALFAVLSRNEMSQKKGGAEAPPFTRFTADQVLVSVLLASGGATADALASRRRVARAGTRIGDDDCQIAHGEVTCANIADERKAVSVLEVAHREHVALEARGDGLQSVD